MSYERQDTSFSDRNNALRAGGDLVIQLHHISQAMNELVLKDFRGAPEITADAYELKRSALKAASKIARVETPEQQLEAVEALRQVREVLKGMEATRKAVKAPVLDLGKKIDNLAHVFTADIEKQQGRIQGLINHFQKVQQRKANEEREKIASEQASATELRRQALVAREAGRYQEAESLEAKAFDSEMTAEVTTVAVVDKPKGLVVKNRINFQVLDAIVFCQAWPGYWKWHGETETLKLDRMKVLDALNSPKCDSDFHKSRFPEELSVTDDSRLVQPAGLRVFEETRAHLR